MTNLLHPLIQHRSLRLGGCLLLFVVFGSIIAEFLIENSPYSMDAKNRFVSPDIHHWFGTDSFGRDVFSRVIYGSRISMGVGIGVTALTGVFGGLLGAVAGYWRTVDNFLMRAMDALMAFPTILLAVAIAAALGPSVANVIVALSITNIPRAARIMRASVLTVRETGYVQSAESIGAKNSRIVFFHVIPNSLAPFLVQLSFVFSAAVLSEAILSFLGVGISPTIPTWGSIIAEGRNYIWEAPWITIFPGVAIFIAVLGLNLVGDGLRDLLDPRDAQSTRRSSEV